MGINIFHIFWIVPLWIIISFAVCLLTKTVLLRWPGPTQKIRRYWPFVFISILVELIVYHVFDPSSAAEGIFWVPPLHYANLALGTPAFMLFVFDECFRAKGERRFLIVVPVIFLCLPISLLHNLHDIYTGLTHIR